MSNLGVVLEKNVERPSIFLQTELYDHNAELQLKMSYSSTFKDELHP